MDIEFKPRRYVEGTKRHRILYSAVGVAYSREPYRRYLDSFLQALPSALFLVFAHVVQQVVLGLEVVVLGAVAWGIREVHENLLVVVVPTQLFHHRFKPSEHVFRHV